MRLLDPSHGCDKLVERDGTKGRSDVLYSRYDGQSSMHRLNKQYNSVSALVQEHQYISPHWSPLRDTKQENDFEDEAYTVSLNVLMSIREMSFSGSRSHGKLRWMPNRASQREIRS
jgi:hypothetical protein